MILKSDCKYFPGDRPCSFNKREGVKCDVCPYYETEQARILIIKLEAVGDVLRTTCILHGLKDKYPTSEITWITCKSAVLLFENNKLVNHVFAYESTEAILHVMVEEFDVVINLDSASDSAVLATAAKGKEKIGYGFDTRGNVFPFNTEAITWLEMGAFDDLKKKNTRSFQDLMLDICRLKTTKKDIIVELSEEELRFAHSFAEQFSLDNKLLKIGMNTGASGRWQFKQWTLEGFEKLIKLLLERTNALILLYGGPSEKERNEHLSKLYPTRVVNTGAHNSLRQFFALVTLSDVFLTCDTLALHVATALKKKIIALFGPTSAAEIDSYNGQIVKVQANLDCLVCYKPRCDFNPNCMNSITPEQLLSIIQKHLP
ncbi:MAG: glycosyltransferase family 9 protein [Bacteroidota bacterium]|jgi:heptosyltransferase-2